MLDIGVTFVDLRANNVKNIGIFFDSVTQKVCCVRSEKDESTISAKSLDPADHEILFNVSEKGNRIRAICFSPDLQIASLQQEDTLVEFILLEGNKVTAEFKQLSRFKGSVILGIHWASDRQIAFVTDAGCEFYLVNTYKRSLKLIKHLALSVNWFSFYYPSNLFVCASGVSNNMLTCITFQNNNPNIIGKFEVDFGCSPSKPRLLEREIAIASIFGKISILLLYFEASQGFVAGLSVYQFTEEQQIPTKIYFLKLDLIGLVGLHVIDNLILIHHKNAQTTLVFDISLDPVNPVSSTVLHISRSLHSHLISPSSNPALTLPLPSPDSFLYNAAWKMCLPDFVIDLQYELFTKVSVDFDRIDDALTIKDTDFLVNFLINRRDGEKPLLSLLQRIILHKLLKFTHITQIFRRILHADDTVDESEGSTSNKNCKRSHQPVPFAPLSVSHNNLLRFIFEPLNQNSEMDKTFLANLMVEFFLVLNTPEQQKHIKVQETYISELLVKILVDADMFDRLQQLLQYGVIEKSKFLAYELIALSTQCPALYPISLDMLKKRRDWEQIVEILMTRGHLLEALRLLLDAQLDRAVFNKTLRKLLDKTWKSDDRQLMFTVFSYLNYPQARKQLAEVMSNDDLERYMQEYKLLYDQEEVEEAVKRFRMARLSSIRRHRSSYRNDSFTSVGGDANEDTEEMMRERRKRNEEEGSSSNRTDGSSDQQSAGTTDS